MIRQMFQKSKSDDILVAQQSILGFNRLVTQHIAPSKCEKEDDVLTVDHDLLQR